MSDQVLPTPADAGPLSIGDLARATGVAVATLRMWESRHGFPRAHRTPAGHRRYSSTQVTQVLAVVQRRDAGMRLEAAMASVDDDLARTTSSVYAVLTRDHPAQPHQRLRKSTLVALSRAIEDELSASAASGHLFGAFQTVESFDAAQERWGELARTARSTVALADFGPGPGPGPDAGTDGIERIALATDSPLLREWAVVNDSPTLPVALSAWELPDQRGLDDADRLFESIWTVDPHAVRAASRVCTAVAARAGSTRARELIDGPLAGAPPAEPDLLVVSRLVHRMVAYVEGSGRS